MSQQIEFGSKDGADAAREEWTEYVCPVDDDARLKTVAFVSDLPDDVRELIEAGAQAGRVEREGGPGIAHLNREEKRRLGPFTGSNNYGKAVAVKALLLDNGISDWEAYYDSELTVDEHRHRLEEWRSDQSGGDVRDGPSKEDRKRDAKRREAAHGEECDHAKEHCEHGEPEACEFLRGACGYSDEETAAILEPDTRHQGDDTEQTDLVPMEYDGETIEVTPEQAGALRRAWRSYKAAVGNLDRLLSEVREEVTTSRQAFAAINRIRGEEGQDDLHPDRLHDLAETLAGMPESIPEVRTLDHFGAVDGADEHPRPEAKAYPPMENDATGQDDPGEAIEADPQRDLSGDLSNPQTRFAGTDRSEVESEVEEAATVEQNEGGLLADTRDGDRERPTGDNTEQAIPDEFRVAEGGQETL